MGNEDGPRVMVPTRNPGAVGRLAPKAWRDSWPDHVGIIYQAASMQDCLDNIPNLLTVPCRKRVLLLEGPLTAWGHGSVGESLLLAGLLGFTWACPDCGDGTKAHLAEWATSGGARPLRGVRGSDRRCPVCGHEVERGELGVHEVWVLGATDEETKCLRDVCAEIGVPVLGR